MATKRATKPAATKGTSATTPSRGAAAPRGAAPSAPKKEPIPSAGGPARALLEAIWADPQDRDALRVYADHLLEQGNSRGEYIQLSVLENPTAAQSTRASTLEKKDRGAWLGTARPYVRTWSLSSATPGFVDHAWCEADKLIDGFDELVALGPRLVLSVTSMRKKRRETEARMAKLPLHEIHDLDLSGNALDDKSITTLAPALAGIRALHVSENPITGEGIAALGAVVHTLEYLQVGTAVSVRDAERTAAVEGIARAIATTPGFRSLRYVHFFRTGPVSPEAARMLHALPSLKRLSTSGYTEWGGLEPERWNEPSDV